MATTTSGVTTRPITSTTAIQPPVYKPEEYTVAGIILKFFEEKAKDIAKALGYSAFWVGQAIPDLPPEVKSFSAMMGDFKNFISVTEVPKKVIEAWEALKGLWCDLTKKSGPWGKVSSAASKAFQKSTALTSSVIDSIDLTNRFMPIDKSVMAWLKGIGFASTLGGATNSGREQIQKLAETQPGNTTKKAFHLINIARDASYVALGILGLSFALTGAAVVPWMLVTCLTSGLGLTIIGGFCEKIYDPEGKGKNLNPEAVIENTLARRAYEQRVMA
jgi:hypothetical protein